jgi:glucose/arabinose dehydrogenase
MVALAALVAFSGCDKNRPPTTPGDNQITGNERLGWDQQAANATELATFRYALYIDGARNELADASCANAAGSSGFACTARFPSMSVGSHTLELATFVAGNPSLESARSSPLSVTVVRSAAVSTTGWAEEVTTVDGVRLTLERIADGLHEPTDAAFESSVDSSLGGPALSGLASPRNLSRDFGSLSILPPIDWPADARLFVTEREGRVRIIRDGRLLPQPALVLEDTATKNGGALLSLALHPRFDRTHLIFLLYSTLSRDGAPVFHVRRYREEGDVLVEGITLLDDVPAASARPSASLGFGPDEKLYIAFDDAGDPRRGGDLASFNGKVLRINPDRSTPDDQPAASPVFSYPYRAPRAFDWQPGTGTLWIADGVPGAGRLHAVVIGDGPAKRTSVRASYDLSSSPDVGALAFYRGEVTAFSGDLFLAAGQARHILRVRFDAADRTRVTGTERLLENAVGDVPVVATGPDGSIYFCTAHEIGRLVPVGQP